MPSVLRTNEGIDKLMYQEMVPVACWGRQKNAFNHLRRTRAKDVWRSGHQPEAARRWFTAKISKAAGEKMAQKTMDT